MRCNAKRLNNLESSVGVIFCDTTRIAYIKYTTHPSCGSSPVEVYFFSFFNFIHVFFVSLLFRSNVYSYQYIAFKDVRGSLVLRKFVLTVTPVAQ